VEEIHACKNDYILYRGEEYEDLEKCPICGFDRFNHRKDGGDDDNCDRFNHRKDGGDDNNCNRRKGGSKNVFWYFPIIPRLKRWFANKKELELLQ
jgi:hypothetical protein